MLQIRGSVRREIRGMSVTLSVEREFLTRKEAAEYLSRRWFKMSVPTLNKHAVQCDGPRYINRGANGGDSMYRRCDLDSWAQSFIDKPLGKRRQKQNGSYGRRPASPANG
jgi:hypothetical protein